MLELGPTCNKRHHQQQLGRLQKQQVRRPFYDPVSIQVTLKVVYAQQVDLFASFDKRAERQVKCEKAWCVVLSKRFELGTKPLQHQ
jgi:hypothetical protein